MRCLAIALPCRAYPCRRWAMPGSALPSRRSPERSRAVARPCFAPACLSLSPLYYAVALLGGPYLSHRHTNRDVATPSPCFPWDSFSVACGLAGPCLAKPRHAAPSLPYHTRPCPALPCLAQPHLAEPRLPCHAIPSRTRPSPAKPQRALPSLAPPCLPRSLNYEGSELFSSLREHSFCR